MNPCEMKALIDNVMVEDRGYPIVDFYLESGLTRQEFEYLFYETIETYKEWVPETGGSCRKIKGKRGELDGFTFGGERSWRSIRRKLPSERAPISTSNDNQRGNPFDFSELAKARGEAE